MAGTLLFGLPDMPVVSRPVAPEFTLVWEGRSLRVTLPELVCPVSGLIDRAVAVAKGAPVEEIGALFCVILERTTARYTGRASRFVD